MKNCWLFFHEWEFFHVDVERTFENQTDTMPLRINTILFYRCKKCEKIKAVRKRGNLGFLAKIYGNKPRDVDL